MSFFHGLSRVSRLIQTFFYLVFVNIQERIECCQMRKKESSLLTLVFVLKNNSSPVLLSNVLVNIESYADMQDQEPYCLWGQW